MTNTVHYHFSWNEHKAQRNLKKHGVSFDEAMLVFNDPLALTLSDDDHGEDEERWITLGTVGPHRLLLVVHTMLEIQDNHYSVRLISARKATPHEIRQYEG